MGSSDILWKNKSSSVLVRTPCYFPSVLHPRWLLVSYKTLLIFESFPQWSTTLVPSIAWLRFFSNCGIFPNASYLVNLAHGICTIGGLLLRVRPLEKLWVQLLGRNMMGKWSSFRGLWSMIFFQNTFVAWKKVAISDKVLFSSKH